MELPSRLSQPIRGRFSPAEFFRSDPKFQFNWQDWTRTSDHAINSRTLYQLSYMPSISMGTTPFTCCHVCDRIGRRELYSKLTNLPYLTSDNPVWRQQTSHSTLYHNIQFGIGGGIGIQRLTALDRPNWQNHFIMVEKPPPVWNLHKELRMGCDYQLNQKY